MIRPLVRALLLVCVAPFTLLACGASTSDPAKSPSAAEGTRDTEIKHEPCDKDSPEAQKIDANGDGRPDIIHVMKGGREVCRVVDLNLDGAIDAFIYYDDKGLERRRESDFDRDGRADEIAIYEGGVIVRKERETNFDGKIDTWDHYEGGRLVRRERDSNGDGVIDQWWQFNDPTNPKCATVATDQNGDGKPDPNSVVDLCGESYGAPKPYSPPSAGAPAAVPGQPVASPPPAAGAAPRPPAARKEP